MLEFQLRRQRRGRGGGRPLVPLGVSVLGLRLDERLDFEDMVNFTRTRFDVPNGVSRRHLLDDVSLPDALVAIDEEAFVDAGLSTAAGRRV
jgi:hypothetical protein